MKRWSLLVVFVLNCAAFILAQAKPAADLIIQNARIWTVDSSHPEAEAVAVLGDRIVAVGTNSQVDAWRGPQTHVVDAKGRRLLPGFNDAHVHFTDGGAQLDSVELNDVTSTQEFAAASPSAPRKPPRANGCKAAIGMRPSGVQPSCPPKN